MKAFLSYKAYNFLYIYRFGSPSDQSNFEYNCPNKHKVFLLSAPISSEFDKTYKKSNVGLFYSPRFIRNEASFGRNKLQNV